MNTKLSSQLILGLALLVAGAMIPAQSLRAAQGGARYTAPAEDVTLVGCVVSEHDWRKANRFPSHPIGVDHNYILVDASKVPASTEPSGSKSNPATYELSGKNERLAKPFLGQPVELIGRLKAQEMGPNGPTGGPSAGFTQDLRLREVDVASIHGHTGGGPCPSMSVN